MTTESTENVATPGGGENPHFLWRQIMGFVIWVGLFTLPLGLEVALIGYTLGGVTFADAWQSGIYKHPDKKSFLNISPMAWGVVMVGLLIAAYPTYLMSRNKLRTHDAGSGFFAGTIVLGGALLLLFIFKLLLAPGLAP